MGPWWGSIEMPYTKESKFTLNVPSSHHLKKQPRDRYRSKQRGPTHPPCKGGFLIAEKYFKNVIPCPVQLKAVHPLEAVMLPLLPHSTHTCPDPAEHALQADS